MLSDLMSQDMAISVHKNGGGNGCTGVDISAFAMKVVQSKEDLFYYALRREHSKPVLARRSKGCQARAQGVHHKAEMVTNRTATHK